MPTRVRKKASISAAERERIIQLAEINGKLDRILGQQDDFCERLEAAAKTVAYHAIADDEYQKKMSLVLTGDPGDENKIGLAGRIKTLEDEKRRWDKGFWFVATTVAALVITRVFDWFKFAAAQAPSLPK
jgi:hypothetical protein